MRSTPTLLRELRPTLLLAVPIVAGHVGQILLSVTDSIMVGQVGAVPLAASTFAGALFGTVFIVVIGLLTSIAVRASFEHGARDGPAAAGVLRHGLALGTAAGIGGGFLLHFLALHLEWFGQAAEVAVEARRYLMIIGWSLVPGMMFVALKNYLEALTRPWIPLRWVLIGVGLNVVLNWILIFGHLGAPALGLEGAGWATAISRVVSLVGLAAEILLSPSLAAWRPKRWLAPLARRETALMLKLGTPAAVQLFFEGSLFNTAALMMGWLGVVPQAAHQVALTCAATTFMIPLGISQALSVRIGQARGSGQNHLLRPIGIGGIGAGALIMLVSATIFVLAGRPIAATFIDDPAVVALAIQLLVIAGIFQIFDGTQVTAIGALRGLADVTWPTVITAIGYWALAMPAAWFLGFRTSLGPLGIWSGLVVGLAACALLLLGRFIRLTRIA